MSDAQFNTLIPREQRLIGSCPARPRWLLGILGGCLAVDLLKHAGLMLAGPIQPWPDSAGYWHLGQDVVQGDWWQIGTGMAYRTPVYPWFLAVFQAFCGPYALFGIVLTQHALELAVSWLTAATTWRITRTPALVIVTYLWCIGLTARSLFANTVLTETCAVFLLSLFLWQVSGSGFALRWTQVAAAGCTLGLAILERPAAVAWVPALAWAAAMFAPPDLAWKQRILRTLLALGMAFAILVPWCVRNTLVWNRFTVSIFLGRELWTANFSAWPGAHLIVPDTGPGRELKEHLKGMPVNYQHNWSVASALSQQGLNDKEVDDLMKDVSLQAIRQSPRQVGFHFVARCLTFWYVKDWELNEADYPSQEPWRGQQSWSNEAFRHGLESWLRWSPERFFYPVWCWTVLTWLGVLVLLLHPPRRSIGVLLAGILLGLTVLTAALEIPCYRYRCIVEPAMIVATVTGLSTLCHHRCSRPAMNGQGLTG